MYVLDTSAFIAGVKHKPEEVIFPLSVVDELKDKPIDFELYRVCEPSQIYIEKVIEASMITGDYNVLSSTDIDVLAVALEHSAVIVTDDYAIQNVAAYLGLKFENGEMQGIKELRRWKWRCTGCGRYYRNYYDECPVCGSSLRRVRDKELKR